MTGVPLSDLPPELRRKILPKGPEPQMTDQELAERRAQYAATKRAQRRAAADPDFMALLRNKIRAGQDPAPPGVPLASGFETGRRGAAELSPAARQRVLDKMRSVDDASARAAAASHTALIGGDHVSAGGASPPYPGEKGASSNRTHKPGKAARPDRPMHCCHGCGAEFAAWAPAVPCNVARWIGEALIAALDAA